MGESRESKQQRARLEERDRQAYELQRQYLEKADKQTPLEAAVEKSRLEDISYFNQEKPDYTVAPKGMIDTTAFGKAALNRLRERAGTGSAQMGMYGANPNLLALNRDAEDRRVAEEGAGEYAERLGDRRAEAYGGSEAVIGRNVGRALTLSGQTAQQANQAGQNLAQFRPTPSMWSQLALAGIQGAAGVAGSYLTGGFNRAAGGR